jgi:GTP-binding protein
MMIDWARNNQVPLHIILTKSDKLKRGAIQDSLRAAQDVIKDIPMATVQEFSSLKNIGVDALAEKLDTWLDTPESQ